MFFKRLLSIVWCGYEYLAMLFGLTTLLTLCLLGLPAALLCLCLAEIWREKLGRWLISTSFTFYLWVLRIFCSVRLDTRALMHIKNDSPLIVIANHPSLLDAVILLALLPNATCVMKASLRNNPLLGAMSRLAGYISNAEPMQLIKKSCQELAKGKQILIFPESTRTVTFPINRFSQMSALMALRAPAPIQIVFIEFSSAYLGKSMSLFQKPTLPLHIKLSLGTRENPSGDVAALTERLEFAYQDYFDSSLNV